MTLERQIARLVRIGTYASVVLLALGVVALVAAGRSVLDGGPDLDLGSIPVDLVALRPEALLWIGLLVAIGSPAARVALALVRFVRDGEREMAGVAVLVLVVIVLSVALALITGG